ncbi:C39 family peptidase [Patescibacteria group bacterium]|nr:C39 family peptidase [Patescibacteria group bacterium]
MKKGLFQRIVISFVALAVIFVFNFWLFSPRDISKNKKSFLPDIEQSLTKENKNINRDNQLKANDEGKQAVPIKDFLDKDNQINYNDVNSQEAEGFKEEKQDNEEEFFEQSINLSVPFVSQSPFAKWDDIHNEACEEASLIIANHWLSQTELTKEKADKIILSAVKWQQDNWGGHYDLNVANTIDLAREYFGIKKIYYTFVEGINDIKRELNKGNIILAPMAGRVLDNKYYRNPGPAYHMLVVKGYNSKEVITSDPGTKRGEDFKYSYTNFLEAIHDWPFDIKEKKEIDKEQKAIEILKGDKIIIVIEPLK